MRTGSNGARRSARNSAPQVSGRQLKLPLGKPAPAGAESVRVGRRTIVVHLVRHPRARRYLLRVLPDLGVRLTVPRWGNRANALAFLRHELRWVDLQKYAAARNAARFLFRGELLTLRSEGTPPEVCLGTERTRLRQGESPRQAATRHLRALAARELPERLRALAVRLGITVKRVTVRSQQTRWGSCSPGGAIALNWRLVQMPDSVAEYVLVHELMHVHERNHARRFWSRVEHACPWHREARRWLKVHGGELA